MEIMPISLMTRFMEVGTQDYIEDPIILAHFYNPDGAGHWYAIEYDWRTGLFFGYVSIAGDQNDEWESFSLLDMETTNEVFGHGIQRDVNWKEKPASQVIPGFTGVIRDE